MLLEIWSWHDYVLFSCSHHEAKALNIARIIYIYIYVYIGITDNFEITILVAFKLEEDNEYVNVFSSNHNVDRLLTLYGTVKNH